MFASLFRRLFSDPSRTRSGQPRRFVPELTVLEDRSLPSANHGLPLIVPASAASQQQRPFRETLTVVSVSPTGVVGYEGTATHLGRVTATLNPDNTFTKTAANGDTTIGFITAATATTGTITVDGGTGRFVGATGLSDYLISVNPSTGVTTVDVQGFISYAASSRQGNSANGSSAHNADSQVVPFKISGEGYAPEGIPVFPGGTAPHTATGTATHLGTHSGAGRFRLLSIDPATGTGTFQTAEPFVFVAQNGDRLAFHYGRTDAGAATAGTFSLTPTDDGKAIAVFVAEFTLVPAESTGRFAKYTSGSFIMTATTQPFVPVPNLLGFTPDFHYTWVGEGTLTFAKGKK